MNTFIQPKSLVFLLTVLFAISACSDDDETTTVTVTETVEVEVPAVLTFAETFGKMPQNPYFPLISGLTYRYEAEGENEEDGDSEFVLIFTFDTKTIDGIGTLAVIEHEYEDDALVENSTLWLALDRDGAVWQLGEDSVSYEDGMEVESESWQAGEDDAEAVLLMPANPKVNDSLTGDDDETMTVTSVTASVDLLIGEFDNVLEIQEVDDEGTELAHYAMDLGLIQLQDEDGMTYVLEEVEYRLAAHLNTDPEMEAEEEEELSEAMLFFELNDTDGDLGIHGKADGDAWQTLTIEAPNGEEILEISLSGKLAEQGLTELFFESAEPVFDELAPSDFFARFPEGSYEIDAETEEGVELEAEIMLSHVIPAAPDEISIHYPVECEEGMVPDEDGECATSLMLPPAEFELDDEGELELVCVEIEDMLERDISISWAAVTVSHKEKGTTAPHGQFLGNAGEISVLHYEFVLETEDENEMELVSSSLVPADVTEFELPSELLELSDEFKFEILVRDANGNQSASEACFEIAGEEEEEEEEDEEEEEG